MIECAVISSYSTWLVVACVAVQGEGRGPVPSFPTLWAATQATQHVINSTNRMTDRHLQGTGYHFRKDHDKEPGLGSLWLYMSKRPGTQQDYSTRSFNQDVAMLNRDFCFIFTLIFTSNVLVYVNSSFSKPPECDSTNGCPCKPGYWGRQCQFCRLR
jgi:hypothetical protein